MKKKAKTYYVYILPFSDGIHFKIGKSSESHIRIRKLHRDFKFKIEECKRIKCKKEEMSKLESFLLKTLTKGFEVKDFTSNGCTEIRLMTCYKSVQDYLETKKIEPKGFSTQFKNIIIAPTKKRTIVEKPKPENNFYY